MRGSEPGRCASVVFYASHGPGRWAWIVRFPKRSRLAAAGA